ncbi:HdeD family acid-resistance protein [Natronoglycomyces albus]|uniref:DUF308 domain-containing protein n=1 Tax=Natronoglycomyces albus TaxID=2811108 RepID=A0A895XQS5_9ACTN|nr:DUF308 domain-containing protein [Natronoglycomyces albus]QSB04906.1 DUF308 domain-containing protein [Natronoglycomyces albus]
MDTVLTVKWRLIVARGLLAVVIGLLLIAWPDLSLVTAIVLFGSYALADGLITIFISFTRRSEDRWIPLVLGWVGILIAVFILAWPDKTTALLLWTAAAWALTSGIGYMVLAYRSKGEGASMSLFGAIGLITVVLALLLAVRPDAPFATVATTFGVFAVAWGVLSVVLGVRLRDIVAQLRRGEVSHPEQMP